MDNDIIPISISDYRQFNNLNDSSRGFSETIHFDRANGLQFVSTGITDNYFRFKIIDKERFILARIKYGF